MQMFLPQKENRHHQHQVHADFHPKRHSAPVDQIHPEGKLRTVYPAGPKNQKPLFFHPIPEDQQTQTGQCQQMAVSVSSGQHIFYIGLKTAPEP